MAAKDLKDEQPAEGEGAAPVEEKKPSPIKWVIVGVVLLVFIGIEVGLAVFFVNKLKPENHEEIAQQKEKDEAARIQTEMGATLPAPIDITVNIKDEDGRFVKCGIQLEYDAAFLQLGDELMARKSRIKDIIMDIMSSRPLSELMTNQGKKAIREEIVEEVNAILPETVANKPLGKVRRSYFDSFIVQ